MRLVFVITGTRRRTSLRTPARIYVATPQGKLARYFYGIEYAPRDLRLGLIEAAENKIGSPVDQLLLYCYHYDPATGKYGAAVMNLMRVGGVVTLIALAILLLACAAGVARRWRGGPGKRELRDGIDFKSVLREEHRLRSMTFERKAREVQSTSFSLSASV